MRAWSKLKVTVTGCACVGGVVHCGYVCLAIVLLLSQVYRSKRCFLLYIEHAPIERSSRQGQSVKMFPMYEADERYGCLKLVDPAMFAVVREKGNCREKSTI